MAGMISKTTLLSIAGILIALGVETVKHYRTSPIASHFNEYLPDSQMGLNSRISYGTMSCSLLSSALRGTEIEQSACVITTRRAMIGEQYEHNRRIFISNLYNDYEACVSMPLYKGVRFITGQVQWNSLPLYPRFKIKSS